ncbi:hypothetical protein HZA97_07110 [Candidatus Woesearchaeota archaeon]|nr:hypothetical protein [Candidatus Woesearchaeota archaeon]
MPKENKVSDSLVSKLKNHKSVDVVVVAKGDVSSVYTYVFLLEAYFKDKKIHYNQETTNSLTATLTPEQIYDLSDEPSVEFIDSV